MTYQEIQNLSGIIDLRTVLQFPSLDTPMFYPLMLFVIFVVFTLSTFFREMRREGKANILSSLAVAGFVTTAIATLWTFLGLIESTIMITLFVISAIFQVIYLLTSRNP